MERLAVLRYLLRYFDNEDKSIIVLSKFEPFQINFINLKCSFNLYPFVTIFSILSISYFYSFTINTRRIKITLNTQNPYNINLGRSFQQYTWHVIDSKSLIYGAYRSELPLTWKLILYFLLVFKIRNQSIKRVIIHQYFFSWRNWEILDVGCKPHTHKSYTLSLGTLFLVTRKPQKVFAWN